MFAKVCFFSIISKQGSVFPFSIEFYPPKMVFFRLIFYIFAK